MSTAEVIPEAATAPQATLPDAGELLTTSDVARVCKVTRDVVLHWIKSGALAAINVAGNLTGRARYRIEAGDVRSFLEARRSQPKASNGQSTRRSVPRHSNAIEFFRDGKPTGVK
ncbi:MAG: helix-turn-helix domain-containing protein [Planctomycetaceae bacterium]|nr:helix-turn-helix domain-containing protein [Planctomycetaceae bacterium]